MNKMIYGYIIEVEAMMLMKYKINFYESENSMSMLDLQAFVQNIQTKNEQIEKDSKNDNFSKCLVYLRDILNFMTLKDNRAR